MYGIAQNRVAFHCNGIYRKRRLPLLIRDQAVVSFSSLGTRSLITPHSHTDVSSQPIIITSSRNHTHSKASSSCIEQSIHTRNFHTTQYAYSDNLLGHSPMARSDPNKPKSSAISPGSAGPSWGTDANTAGGGVWAQNSSKREKLNELLTELKENGVDTGTCIYDSCIAHILCIITLLLQLCIDSYIYKYINTSFNDTQG